MIARCWPVLALSVALEVVLAGAPRRTLAVAQAGTGSVTGAVTLTAAKAPPLSVSVYGRRGVAPKRLAGVSETRNVVIFVSGRRPAAPPAPMRAKIVQKDEEFVPQLTVVTVGSTVDFPNEDPFFHNVFSLSKAHTFDLGRYASGRSRAETLAKPGLVKVFCHLHSQMTASIMVLDHPWFTTPADDGTFALDDVPAGDLTLVAWHERIGERREQIRVAPGASTRVTFTLPVLEAAP